MFTKLRNKFHSWLEHELNHVHCRSCGVSVRPYYPDYDLNVCTACYVEAISKPLRGRPSKFKQEIIAAHEKREKMRRELA